MALTRAQIQTAFQNSLGRAASANDENSFFSVSQSGALTDAQVYSTISNSQEANLNADPVVRFYQAAFGRVPDQAGLDNATDYVRSFGASAATYQNLSDMFAQSTEFTNRFGTGTAVDAAYVQALYTTILGRQATAGEISGFTSGSNGYTTRGGVLYAISQSQEAIGISDTAVNGFLQNAAEGDAVYTGSLYTPNNGQPNLPNSAGQTFVLTTGVDVLTGTNNADVFIGTLGGGQNATLNSGDSVSGGAGSDTLRITANGNPAVVTPSLTSVENIEVSSFGTAQLNLVNSTGVTKVSTVNGNGNVVVTGLNALVDLAASNTTGGALVATYGTNVVGGLADVQNLSLNNASADLTNGAAATAILVADVETFAVTATGTNNVTFNNNVGNVTFNDTLKTVTVSGSGDLNIGTALSNKVTTFDASASTGDITVAFAGGANNGNVTATGGTGNDTFSFGGGLTANDVVNGGTGADTVRVTTGGDLTGATAAAPFNGLTGIETLAFDGSGVTLNGSTFTNTGITTLEFNTIGADTINNAGSARTYAFGDSNTGAANFALKAGALTLNIDLLGTAGTNSANDGQDADLGGLNIITAGANSTTTAVSINLESQGDLADGFFNTINTADGSAATFGNGQVNQTGAVSVANGSTVTVTGEGNLAIFGGTAGSVTAGFTGNVTLDESAATGNSIIAGSDFAGAAGTVATGGNPAGDPPVANTGGVNTATTQTGSDTITLGSGTDVVVFTSGAASGIAQVATPAGGTAASGAALNGNVFVDTINNFTAGANGDVLFHGTNLGGVNAGAETNYTAIQGSVQTTINGLSGANATLLQAASLAANDAATNWTAFSFQGETYALFDAAQADTGYASGTDNLVKLAGVSVASLTDANFAVGLAV